MFGWIGRLVMRVFGAVQDPKTGNLALSRAAGTTLLTIGTEQLVGAATTPEVAAGSAIILAGTALVAARTKTTQPAAQ